MHQDDARVSLELLELKLWTKWEDGSALVIFYIAVYADNEGAFFLNGDERIN
jgi:hypothetical protein